MKLEIIRCPYCKAPVQIKAGAKQVICPYCGIASEIEEPETAAPAASVPPEAPAEMPPETVPVRPAGRRRTWLWVLGWIVIFPVPATILLARSRKIKPWAKGLFIAAAWALYLLIGLIGQGR